MKHSRLYAIIGTVVFHLIVLLVLLFTFLRFPPDGMVWPPVDDSEIVFENIEDLYASGEFVRTGDNFDRLTPNDLEAPSSEAMDMTPQDGADMANSGVGVPHPTVTSQQDSPAKAETQQKGPTKEEIEAEKARQEAKKQQQTKKSVEDATSKAFGGDKGTGKAGQTDGNADNGATSGTPGTEGLSGRSLEHWTRVSATKLGKITMRVTVDAGGKVTSASYVASRSEGTAAADATLRAQCKEKTLMCRFSVRDDGAEQQGYIVWTFK